MSRNSPEELKNIQTALNAAKSLDENNRALTFLAIDALALTYQALSPSEKDTPEAETMIENMVKVYNEFTLSISIKFINAHSLPLAIQQEILGHTREWLLEAARTYVSGSGFRNHIKNFVLLQIALIMSAVVTK